MACDTYNVGRGKAKWTKQTDVLPVCWVSHMHFFGWHTEMAFASELQGWSSHKALVAVQDFEICLLETIKKCLVQRIKSDREYANALATIVAMSQKQDLYEHNTPFCQVNLFLCTLSSLRNFLVLQAIFLSLGTQNRSLMCFCSLSCTGRVTFIIITVIIIKKLFWTLSRETPERWYWPENTRPQSNRMVSSTYQIEAALEIPRSSCLRLLCTTERWTNCFGPSCLYCWSGVPLKNG